MHDLEGPGRHGGDFGDRRMTKDTAPARRSRRNQTRPISIQHGDLSQVWVPIDRPPIDPKLIAKDCARRAAMYSRSPFWSKPTLLFDPALSQLARQRQANAGSEGAALSRVALGNCPIKGRNESRALSQVGSDLGTLTRLGSDHFIQGMGASHGGTSKVVGTAPAYADATPVPLVQQGLFDA